MTQVKLCSVPMMTAAIRFCTYDEQNKEAGTSYLSHRNKQIPAGLARNIEFGDNLANFDPSCTNVNSNIQVGVAARNIKFGDNLANFDSLCTPAGLAEWHVWPRNYRIRRK